MQNNRIMMHHTPYDGQQNLAQQHLAVHPNRQMYMHNPQNRQEFIKEKSYFKTAPGVLRILIALFELGGLGAIAGVIKLFTILPDEFTLIRDSYMAVTILGFVFSITILGLSLLDSIRYKVMKRMYWNVIILISDIFWLIPMFILGIICAIKEGNVKDYLFLNSTYLNRGAFGAAGGLAFLAALLLTVDACLHLLKILCKP